MKKKLFMLLAMVLLSSVSVFAQSGNNEPLKGDVNEDGVVDVADIVAVIDIIRQGGSESEVSSYYYKLYTGNSSSWFPSGSVPQSLEEMTQIDINNSSFQINLGAYGFILYVCLPKNKSFETDKDGEVKAYDSLGLYQTCYISNLDNISPNHNMFKISARSNGYNTRTFKIE